MATPVYIKPSSIKAITPPVKAPPARSITTQVADIKSQYGNMNTEQLYSAMLNVQPPAQADLLHAVGQQYGYNDRLAGLRQQASEIQKKMLGDQSALFSATNPDGSAVDPRVKVAQYQQGLTSGAERLNQIQKVQDVYSAEMQTLAGAMADQYKAKAQSTQSAIQFMQQLNQEKNADRSFGLQKDQFEFQKDQFEYQKGQAGKPEWVQDTNGNWTDKNSSTNPADQVRLVSQVFSSPFQKSKNVSLSSQAMGGFSAAMDELNGIGVYTLIGSDTRSHDEQSKLYSNYKSGKGGIAAPPGSSKHEKGNGIDIYSDGKYSAPTKAQIQVMEKNGWKHMNIAGDMGHFEYVGTSGTQNNRYSPSSDVNLTQVASGKNGGIFLDKRTGKSISGEEAQTMYGKIAGQSTDLGNIQYKNYLKSLLPNTQKDSAVEIANLEKDMKVYQKAGLNMQQAGLAARGFSIRDQQNIDSAIQVLNVFNNMKVQPTGYEAKVSNYLNAGDIKGLNNYITTALDREVEDVHKTESTSTPQMMALNSNTKELVSLIQKNGDKIGIVEGNLEQFVSKFKGTPEFQKIKTLLQGMQATQRKFFAGSAVTPTEMEALKDFIGGTQTMNAENLITQLETVQALAQKKYNSQRSIYLGDLNVGDPTGGSQPQPQNKNTTIPGLPPPKGGTSIGKW